MPVLKTAVGFVDKEAPAKLQEDFDTDRIRDAIDDLDDLRAELHEPDEPDAELYIRAARIACLFLVRSSY